MTRLLCMRLGTGQPGATLVTCILRDGSPRTQADMWSSSDPLGGPLQPAVRVFLCRPAVVHPDPGVGWPRGLLLNAARTGDPAAPGKPWHHRTPVQPSAVHAQPLVHDRCPLRKCHERFFVVLCAQDDAGAHTRSRFRGCVGGSRVPDPAARCGSRPRSYRLCPADAPRGRAASHPDVAAAPLSTNAVCRVGTHAGVDTRDAWGDPCLPGEGRGSQLYLVHVRSEEHTSE